MRTRTDNEKKFTDCEVMLEALKSFSWAMEYADDSLKADREFMLEAFKIDMSRKDDWQDGNLDGSEIDRKTFFLAYADDTLRFDREFILEAVKLDSYALGFADDTLKADRELVLEASKY